MLTSLGALVGLLSGLLGVGGGTMLVPILVALDYAPLNAVATSALAVSLTALSGSLYNWKQKAFDWKDLSAMILPCMFATQAGVWTAMQLKPALLLLLFGMLLISAMILLELKTRFMAQALSTVPSPVNIKTFIFVGGIAGFLSGMFGVGGGVILVPLQLLLLSHDLKTAIRNSLVVVVFASLFSAIGHGFAGNILYRDGLLIGVGGIAGAQLGSYLLPRIDEALARLLFGLILIALAAYVFWQAYHFKIS